MRRFFRLSFRAILISLSRPFADAVHAGVASFMCSYNLLNNSQACQNSYLLNHILKEELGFQVSNDALINAPESIVANANTIGVCHV